MAEEEDQAEEKEGDGDENDGESKADGKSGKKKLVLIVAVALIVIGGAVGGAGFFFGWFGGGSEAVETVEDMPQKPAKIAVFYDLPQMTVNLSSADNRAQYLKILITLELPNEEMIEMIEPYMPRVLDAFQTHLRELRMTDLEGSSGLFRLKEELAKRINLTIHPAHIDAVLFKEIIIQ